MQEKINCVWKEAVAHSFVGNKQWMGAIAEKITKKHNTIVDQCVDTGYRYYFCKKQSGLHEEITGCLKYMSTQFAVSCASDIMLGRLFSNFR